MKLHRRTLLRGLMGGAVVGVGLPPLEAFFNTSGTAYASGEGLPKRFGLFFWGNGIHPAKWTPSGEGAGYVLSEQLAALEPVRSKLTVVTGMSVKTGNTTPHWSGPAGFLSGSPVDSNGDDVTFRAPTIDQVLAQELGQDSRFKSLQIGTVPREGVSFNGPAGRNPPEASPRRFFDRVFGAGYIAPGTEPKLDPKLRLRRSVLDGVKDDADRLKARLGSADRRRLDQHLDGIRELERRISRLEQSPPSLAACAIPAAPNESYPEIDGRPQLSAISRAMADILAMTLACDQTRVFGNYFSYPVNNVLFPGARAGHHQLTHDEPGEQPSVDAIVKMIMGELAYFLGALEKVEEGDGTLLDHSLVLCTSDVSFPRTHSLEEFPILLAGSASGAIKTGIHYRSPSAENTSKVILSVLRAMGLRRTEFGTEGGHVTEGLGAIEA